MDSADLQKIAERTRTAREVGIALTIASGILAVFLLVPVGRTSVAPDPAAGELVADMFQSVSLEADAAIVYDLALGRVLYSKNADAQLPLASLTKLLTVYAALSVFTPDTLVTISNDMNRLEGPNAFPAGEIFSLADLARLTLTASLNDGAVAIAEALAVRENSPPVQVLAGAAAALDLSQTYAVNGSGLDMSAAVSGGYGSARDIARLAGALVARAPDIALATTYESAQAKTMGGRTFTVRNTNPVVDSVPHLLLSKTGLTDLAGGNLALVFDVGIGHPIAVVVLGSSQTGRFTDGSALVAATFAHFAGTSAP